MVGAAAADDGLLCLAESEGTAADWSLENWGTVIVSNWGAWVVVVVGVMYASMAD